MRPSIRAAVVGIMVAAVLSVPAAAGADPGKSPQWITLTGTCDGVPTVLTDPPGPGPTAFNLADGRVGVGRLFEVINLLTGEVILSGKYQASLEHANQPIVVCEFPIPPEFSPDGTANWVFRVTAFLPGQG
jgi:hypothetical protein